MKRPYDFEDIEDYLNGKMNDADRTQFEVVLADDPELVTEVNAVRAEAKLLRMLRDKALMDQFAAWDEEPNAPGIPVADTAPPKAGATKISRWKLLLVACILITGLGLLGIFQGWFSNQDKKPKEDHFTPQDTTTVIETLPGINGEEKKTIAEEQNPGIPEQSPERKEKQTQGPPQNKTLAEQYEIEPNYFGDLQRDTSTEKNNYQKAVAFYNDKKYRQALNLLQEPDSAELQQYLYLRAYTYYKLGLFDLAGEDFRAFRKYPLARKKYDAQWGEVLCLLRTLPKSKAALLTLLDEIIAVETHAHRRRALEVKKALEK